MVKPDDMTDREWQCEGILAIGFFVGGPIFLFLVLWLAEKLT